MRIAECHPDRPHQAKGLCALCYFKQYDAARREKRKAERRKDPRDYSPKYHKYAGPPARRPTCHPDKKHAARGLCGACYQRETRLIGPGNPACHPDRPLLAKGMCHQCYAKSRYWDDPAKFQQAARESQAQTRKRVRDQLVEAYGGKCACPQCPEANSAFLTLDHINGGGRAHRLRMGSHTYADLRRQGWPQEGYRLLCWNCNAMTRGGQPCPHTTT